MKKIASKIVLANYRGDADVWSRRCGELGFSSGVNLQKAQPTMSEMQQFFKSSPDWVFFGGHLTRRLYNDTSSHSVFFYESSVTIQVDSSKQEIKKASSEFGISNNLKVSFWGGCNLFGDVHMLKIVRALLGKHLILGFKGEMGAKMVSVLLGKKGNYKDFFDRAKGKQNDLVAVRDAWMETAALIYGKNSPSFYGRFRAMDPDGQEWKLNGERIIRGRKI